MDFGILSKLTLLDGIFGLAKCFPMILNFFGPCM